MNDKLPKKLKEDAITDVIFEVRFDADASPIVPEVALGRFADTEIWKGFAQTRFPVADLPPAVRRAEPNLRYLPTIQLTSPSGDHRIGIGPQSLSLTRTAPYPGWDEQIGGEVDGIIEVLFKNIPGVAVTRLGLRYVNALRSKMHGISSVGALTVKVSLGDQVLSEKLNLNYLVPIGEDTSCMVRVASVDLASGNIPEDATVIVDLDVFTKDGFITTEIEKVKAWCEEAHRAEKTQFFRLLHQDTIDRLRLA